MANHPARALALVFAISWWCTDAFGFPTSRLTYARGIGAEECPKEATVRQAVAARLGYDPFFATADKTIVARILRSRDELRATVELVDDGGTVRGSREFKAPAGQCDELVATVALAISIAIDPTNAGTGDGPPQSRSEPPVATHASVDRAEPPVPVPIERRPAEPHPNDEAPAKPGNQDALELRVGTGLLGAMGTAPATTAGVAFSVGVRKGMWAANVEGRAELPGTVAAANGQVQTSILAVALAPCLHFSPTFVCMTGWLGSLRAQGLGFSTSRTDHALHVATGLRLGVEIPLTTRLVFRPEVDGLVTLFPVDLKLDDASLWVTPGFSALLRTGLVMRFP